MSQKHVALLTEARRLIETTYDCYVCLAVKASARNLFRVPYKSDTPMYEMSCPEVYQIVTLIGAHIAPSKTINEWLGREHGIYADEVQAREYRIRWIDHMIEYWKDKP